MAIGSKPGRTDVKEQGRRISAGIRVKVYNGKNMLLFDTPRYIEQLGWLGRRAALPEGSALLRQFDDLRWDARGSWPYQSLPSIKQLQALRYLPGFSPLTFTSVIRPDADPVASRKALEEMGNHFNIEFRPLKAHLAHDPGLPPARDGYSRRTRNRLKHAEDVFFVEREALLSEHEVMSSWQCRLKKLRSITDSSAPDPRHFAGLIAAFRERTESNACVALRWRNSGALAGVFLFFSDLAGQSWHAHSFLLDDGALPDFGSYLLFDRAVKLLGDRMLWFGGAPAGANGNGVFTFKRRFANCTGQAHILSVDLNDAELTKIRSSHKTFPWLPNYRAPEQTAREPG